MPKLIILGSSNAIPDETHENTHMAIVGNERVILIDCVNNPIVRLHQAGLDVNLLTDLILTHFHPDHVSGVPSLLMNSWLLGRKAPLDIYGLTYTLDRLEALMGFYDWDSWPNFFPVAFHRIPEEEMTPVLQDAEFRIFASPVNHLVPTIGLRVEFPQIEKVLAYSCDTEPTHKVVDLAAGADVLIHEATGATLGHSSAAQAGAIAREAEVGRLYLIHYKTGETDPTSLLGEAHEEFHGSVDLAVDFMELDF
jgi:ribonuclease Z